MEVPKRNQNWFGNVSEGITFLWVQTPGRCKSTLNHKIILQLGSSHHKDVAEGMSVVNLRRNGIRVGSMKEAVPEAGFLAHNTVFTMQFGRNFIEEEMHVLFEDAKIQIVVPRY